MSGPRIKRHREFIYKRDGYRCLKCDGTDNLTIDHIVPKSKGGSDAIGNLQTLCEKCNFDKGVETMDYRRSKAIKPKGVRLKDKRKPKIDFRLIREKD